MNTKRTPLAERFWAKVEKSDGCWTWTGANYIGYGQISEGGRDGRLLKAHRVAYELLVGPIPDGLDLDHLCRNPSCVNPAHLEPVTHRENLRRGMGLVGINARATHCKNGHPFDEANTYHPRRGGRDCRRCKYVRRAAHRRALAAERIAA